MIYDIILRVAVCLWLQYSVLTVLIVVAELAGIAVSAGVRQEVSLICTIVSIYPSIPVQLASDTYIPVRAHDCDL